MKKLPIMFRAFLKAIEENKSQIVSSWQAGANIHAIDTRCPTLTAAMGLGGGIYQ